VEPFRYNYRVFTPEAPGDVLPSVWEKHPDWKFFVRTDIKNPLLGNRWACGGGPTLEEAISAAEFHLWVGIVNPHPLRPGILAPDDPPPPGAFIGTEIRPETEEDPFGGETVRLALDKKRQELKGKVKAITLCKWELFYVLNPPDKMGDRARDSVYPVSRKTAQEEATFFGVEMHEA
jgi:hypothetical protein